MNMSETEKECPLCMEALDWDDLSFFPCSCGYQICRFCWHRLKTDENGLCPACRQAFPDIPVGFNPEISAEELKKQKKRNKDKHRTNKDQVIKPQDLATLRVVQKNLVFVIGLSPRLTLEDLKREFAYFGRIIKFVHNKSTAYITYSKPEEAIRAIRTLTAQATAQESVAQGIQFQQQQQQQYVNGLTSAASSLNYGMFNSNFDVTGNSNNCVSAASSNSVPRLKASLGTTKYCNHFLRSQQCPKVGECMYLHEIAEAEASFTKEQMQAGKHVEYEKRLMDTYLAKFEPNHPSLNQASATSGSIAVATPLTTASQLHTPTPHTNTTPTPATTTTTTSSLANNIDMLNKSPNRAMVAAMAAMMMTNSNSSSPLSLTSTSAVTTSSVAPTLMTLSSSGQNNLSHAAANLFFQSQQTLSSINAAVADVHQMSQLSNNQLQHLQKQHNQQQQQIQARQQQTFIPNLQMPNPNLNDLIACNGLNSNKLSPPSLQQMQRQNVVSAAKNQNPQANSLSVANLDSDDDGLDFDPISVSTSGLRDLLLEQQIQQAKQNLHNNLSGINSNINYSSNYYYYN